MTVIRPEANGRRVNTVCRSEASGECVELPVPRNHSAGSAAHVGEDLARWRHRLGSNRSVNSDRLHSRSIPFLLFLSA